MKPRIRVLIVDDHVLFRGGVKALLSRQEDIEVVGEAEDGLEGVKRAKTLAPDVVLLDLHMPGISGHEAVSLLREEVPAARVLILTVSEDVEDLVAVLKAGALGYLLKNLGTDYLVDSIRRAARGEPVMSPQMAAKLADGLRSMDRSGEIAAAGERHKFSPREREILKLLARGASNKEIARELSLAESTVKIHVQHILRKLNVASRVQAAVYAVEQNLAPKS